MSPVTSCYPSAQQLAQQVQRLGEEGGGCRRWCLIGGNCVIIIIIVIIIILILIIINIIFIGILISSIAFVNLAIVIIHITLIIIAHHPHCPLAPSLNIWRAYHH
jgi:hypothetical protein